MSRYTMASQSRRVTSKILSTSMGALIHQDNCLSSIPRGTKYIIETLATQARIIYRPFRMTGQMHEVEELTVSILYPMARSRTRRDPCQVYLPWLTTLKITHPKVNLMS
jgi:hypothetical protein